MHQLSGEHIKVSILCVTYNQINYIKQTLESFVTQKTNFAFEVIVDDDCSTDGTVDVIRDYAARYPSLIRPSFRPFNTGVHVNGREIYWKANGKYICLCQGDDYFCDDQKLQIQADFLDTHPNHSLCFHPVKIFYDNNAGPETIFPRNRNSSHFTTTELLKGNYIGCNSAMYVRRDDFALPDNIMPDDYYIHLLNAHHGDIGFINRVMACYRIHAGGIWHDSHRDPDALLKRYFISQIRMLDFVLDLHGNVPLHKAIIYSKIDETLCRLNSLDQQENSNLVTKSLLELRADTVKELIQYKYRTQKSRLSVFFVVSLLLQRLKRHRGGVALIAFIKLVLDRISRLRYPV
jgi:glycosyltransferase involved in cell wall biosynthesis